MPRFNDERIANMHRKPGDESEPRRLSLQELEFVSGGAFKVPFPGGTTWKVHNDGGVTLSMPGHLPIVFSP